MAKLDRRDRVSIAAGALVLLGVFVLVVALLLMHPVTALVGVAAIGSGAGILNGQRRMTRRATR